MLHLRLKHALTGFGFAIFVGTALALSPVSRAQADLAFAGIQKASVALMEVSLKMYGAGLNFVGSVASTSARIQEVQGSQVQASKISAPSMTRLLHQYHVDKVAVCIANHSVR